MASPAVINNDTIIFQKDIQRQGYRIPVNVTFQTRWQYEYLHTLLSVTYPGQNFYHLMIPHVIDHTKVHTRTKRYEMYQQPRKIGTKWLIKKFDAIQEYIRTVQLRIERCYDTIFDIKSEAILLVGMQAELTPEQMTLLLEPIQTIMVNFDILGSNYQCTIIDCCNEYDELNNILTQTVHEIKRRCKRDMDKALTELLPNRTIPIDILNIILMYAWDPYV